MKRTANRLLSTSRQFGFDIIKLGNSVLFLPKFIYQLFFFLAKSPIRIRSIYPQLNDWRDSSGVASGHYFHQDIIVARWIYEDNPIHHVDIASRVDGFIAHLAVFRKVEVFDIRPLKTNERNITFTQFDFSGSVALSEKVSSLSCLHSLEHFGLGRYTDKLDVNGHLKGFQNMINLLEENGVFYFSVPIGKTRIEFNAHRIFSLRYIKENFLDNRGLILSKFSYVDDNGKCHEDVDFYKGINDNFGCRYGVGIMRIIKTKKE